MQYTTCSEIFFVSFVYLLSFVFLFFSELWKLIICKTNPMPSSLSASGFQLKKTRDLSSTRCPLQPNRKQKNSTTCSPITPANSFLTPTSGFLFTPARQSPLSQGVNVCQSPCRSCFLLCWPISCFTGRYHPPHLKMQILFGDLHSLGHR